MKERICKIKGCTNKVNKNHIIQRALVEEKVLGKKEKERGWKLRYLEKDLNEDKPSERSRKGFLCVNTFCGKHNEEGLKMFEGVKYNNTNITKLDECFDSEDVVEFLNNTSIGEYRRYDSYDTKDSTVKGQIRNKDFLEEPNKIRVKNILDVLSYNIVEYVNKVYGDKNKGDKKHVVELKDFCKLFLNKHEKMFANQYLWIETGENEETKNLGGGIYATGRVSDVDWDTSITRKIDYSGLYFKRNIGEIEELRISIDNIKVIDEGERVLTVRLNVPFSLKIDLVGEIKIHLEEGKERYKDKIGEEVRVEKHYSLKKVTDMG